MSGDYSRQTFNPQKDRSGVLMQQGRVQLDADWNELVAILERRWRAETADLVGAGAVPKQTPTGFLLQPDPAQGLTIGLGRIYVGGLLAENHGLPPLQFDALLGEPRGTVPIPFNQQPYFPGATLPGDPGLYLVYLDVWQREVTCLEDPELIEKALGVDTTTRLQTVWQVRLLTSPLPAGSTCDSALPDWDNLITPSAGRLTTQAVGVAPDEDPCILPPSGGYRGLENQLYRVEIHDAGPPGTATFKWSRDNATVATSINAIPALDTLTVLRTGRDATLRFNDGDWVELTDDWLEFAQQPGFITQLKHVEDSTLTLTLATPLPAGLFPTDAQGNVDPTRHTRVRRWDQNGQVLDANGNVFIDLNAPGSTGLIPVPAPGTALVLEAGVQVGFSLDGPVGGAFHAGDYWTFAARSADASVEQLDSAPPRGTLHHFCRLALAQFNGSQWSVLENCPPQFPPLSGICAEDVCFDNGICQLGNVKTVQDALNQLCRQRDLRYHNQHLHGWGIVCGLQVNCGGDDGQGRKVRVKPGYAIDCQGNDVNLDFPQEVDVLDLVSQLPSSPLDANGDGTVCLFLAADPEQGIQFQVEPYDPTTENFQSLMAGGLIMDFYNECLKPLADFFKSQFTTPPGEPTAVAGPAQQRLTTLLNLLVQLINPANGQFVLVSVEEDQILRDFYAALRALLQSHTFCAMFANARPLPSYPPLLPAGNPVQSLHTIFGKSFHSRLRIHPGGKMAYTCGGNNTIHVYDLGAASLVAELSFPTAGAIVQDVAFSPDGFQLYAAAVLNNQDTLLALASINGTEHVWQPANVVCDVPLITLATTPAMPNTLYAIGKGTGLYAFNPQTAIPPNGAGMLFVGFNAVGHLVLDGTTAFASAVMQGATSGFDTVVAIDVSGAAGQTPAQFPAPGGLVEDDIAVVSLRGLRVLYVVTSPPGATTKQLSSLNLFTGQSSTVDLLENSAVHLAFNPATGFLVLSFENSYRLALLDPRQGAFLTLPDYRYPTQISPLALAYSASRAEMCVLNYASNTINPIPAALLAPGLDLDLQALSNYRAGVLDAFADLLGGFVQYLKDCFCEHLLVDCPSCDGSEKLYLGCITVKSNQVYQVCNFGRRRYVKSFPTVGYWLSILPVVPLLKKAVELVCCSSLPNLFAKFNAPQSTDAPQRLSGSQIRQGIGFFQLTDFRSLFQQWLGKLNLGSKLTKDWTISLIRKPDPIPAAQKVVPGDIVGQSVEQARHRLGAANIEVAKVQPYNPLAGKENLSNFLRAPLAVTPDTPLVLHEENGIIKYYSVAADPPTATSVQALSAKIEANRQALDEALGLRQETQALKAQLTQLQQSNLQALEERDRQIAALQREMGEFGELKAQVAALAKRRRRPPAAE